MRTMTLCSTILAWALPALSMAAEKTAKDIVYARGADDKSNTSLDVYALAEGADHPIMIWIHGGGWQFGNKSQVHLKPQAFNEKGFVFVSVGYRFHPAVTYKEQAGDIARAIDWVAKNAKEYGGSPEQIYLMGHSAGAHLAALVATDHRYLEAAGRKLDVLKGVVLLDGAGYDVPRQVQLSFLPKVKKFYTNVFTEDKGAQTDASPITHVAKNKGIPPFLILHVARRPDAKIQSEALGAKLTQAGVEVKVVPAEGKSHATINRELGIPTTRPRKRSSSSWTG